MQGTGGGGGSVKKENPSDSLLGQGGWWQEEPHLLPFGLPCAGGDVTSLVTHSSRIT